MNGLIEWSKNVKLLEFDAGNSRLKWRLLDRNKIVTRGYLANNKKWLHLLPQHLKNMGCVDAARASIVSGDNCYKDLSAVIRQFLSVDLLQAKVKPDWCGLKLAYSDPAELGVDRWLAMLEAHYQEADSNKVIIDCGTAVTIDMITCHGVHCGGFILPGITLMKRALREHAANLDFGSSVPETILPGRNRTECINNGVLGMVVNMINTQLTRLSKPVVFLTGGESFLVEPHIHSPSRLHREMVMEGLAHAFGPGRGGNAHALDCV